ncbi:MAG: hypothetical protein ACT4UP_06785 [Gammaproteobacteria bacterium]
MKLEDRGQRGLPAPPAPTRRSANPWKFSDTARRRAPPPQAAREEEDAARMLEELFGGKPAEDAAAKPARAPPASAPPPVLAPPREHKTQSPFKSKRRSGFWPLLMLLLIAGIVVKLVSEGRIGGNWRELAPALFIIFFIAHGWWRSRKRRDERTKDDEAS